MPLFIVFDKKG